MIRLARRLFILWMRYLLVGTVFAATSLPYTIAAANGYESKPFLVLSLVIGFMLNLRLWKWTEKYQKD